eukprot:TRINITY_DN18786_c0_g1_i3.p1 TRINITY_DN18786_c0_g1~~TRINITY_DN18786_c0_g1_i3.p1  ORF type:complete len:215 (-),score=68.17 TRINITY_DN18786_c0_g1_i3:89-733(-)
MCIRDSSEDSAISMAVVFFYFSVSTQTHTGFGDITAVHPAAQLCCCTQMLLGMMYSLLIISQTVGRMGMSSQHSDPNALLHRLGAVRCIKRMRRLARNNLLVVTVVVQLLNYLMLLAIGGGDEFAVRKVQGERSSVDWFVARPEIVSLVIQFINAVMVVLVAFKYVRKTEQVGVGFLVQTFPVSYTHLRAHETVLDLVCRLLLEKKKKPYKYMC